MFCFYFFTITSRSENHAFLNGVQDDVILRSSVPLAQNEVFLCCVNTIVKMCVVCVCVHVCLFSLRNPRRYNVIRIIQGNIGLPWRFKYFSRSIRSFLVFYFSFVAFFFWFSLTHRYTR